MQPDILNDFHYRNHFQEGLRAQIRSDYSICCQLWDIAEKRTLTEPEIELLEKSFSWLRKSLEQYRKLQREKYRGELMGISWISKMIFFQDILIVTFNTFFKSDTTQVL